jgi:CubicO group peptidase (beta-lactamase class C family)
MAKIIAVIIILLFCSYNTIAQTAGNTIEQKIDSLFAEYTNSTPGVAVAVVKDGAIAFKKGYGMANLEYDIPITPQTIFHIASVSKQFTAFAIYLLEKQDRISLEDDIRKYIPELPVYSKTIKIKHLLAHTSGLRDQWAILTLAGWQMEDIITTEQIIRLASRQKELNFEPGTKFGYCNTGYTLLAETVSRITGQTYADFTYTYIFQPLGMEHTRFNDDFHTVLKNRAHSYEMENGKYVERRLNYSNVGATSLTTTVEDMAKWVSNFNKPIVGDPDLIDKFNQVSLLDNGYPVVWAANHGDTVFHAKGQLHLKYKGLKRISHGGHDAGFRAVLLRFPENNLAVITLSNNEHYTMLEKANPIVDMYLSNEVMTKAVPPASPPVQQQQTKTFSNTLADFEGEYFSDELATTYIVKQKGDKLIMSHYRLSDVTLKPIGHDEFSGVNTFAFDMKFNRKKQYVTGFEISNFGAKNVKFYRKNSAPH